MPRGRCKFKQSDLERALRAVRATGIEARVVIAPTGHIEIVPLSQTEEAPATGAAEWDRVETV